MKKLIISKNEIREMRIEEVLNEYRGLACKTYLMLKKTNIVTEDDRQELDIVIFKSFQSYDEKHCFSTHLRWNVRHYVSHNLDYLTRDKRDSSKYQISSLDYEVNDSDGSSASLHESICDVNMDVETIYINKELINYIKDNLRPIELRLLDLNLNKVALKDLVSDLNTTRQNLNNMNKRFKTKLLKLMEKFNKSEFINQLQRV